MDRVIKFRGKSSSKDENHKWLFGGATGTGNNFIVDVTVDGYLCRGIFCPIIPETFGQFTGYKDVDGKEIYEGDIIQNAEFPGDIEKVSMVDGCWSATEISNRPEILDLHWVLSYDSYKVIGNIHDNPELLGGGNDD